MKKVYIHESWENTFSYFETIEELIEAYPARDEIYYHEAQLIEHNLVKAIDIEYLSEWVADRMADDVESDDYSHEGSYEAFTDAASSFGLEKELAKAIESVMNRFPAVTSYTFENISELKTLPVKEQS